MALRPGQKAAPMLKKAAPAAKAAAPAVAGKKSAARPAPAKMGKKGADMTWGGRPNPTPETTIEEKESFLNAAWRYNQRFF